MLRIGDPFTEFKQTQPPENRVHRGPQFVTQSCKKFILDTTLTFGFVARPTLTQQRLLARFLGPALLADVTTDANDLLDASIFVQKHSAALGDPDDDAVRV